MSRTVGLCCGVAMILQCVRPADLRGNLLDDSARMLCDQWQEGLATLGVEPLVPLSVAIGRGVLSAL
jgi:hypothetical protein